MPEFSSCCIDGSLSKILKECECVKPYVAFKIDNVLSSCAELRTCKGEK